MSYIINCVVHFEIYPCGRTIDAEYPFSILLPKGSISYRDEEAMYCPPQGAYEQHLPVMSMT